MSAKYYVVIIGSLLFVICLLKWKSIIWLCSNYSLSKNKSNQKRILLISKFKNERHFYKYYLQLIRNSIKNLKESKLLEKFLSDQNITFIRNNKQINIKIKDFLVSKTQWKLSLQKHFILVMDSQLTPNLKLEGFLRDVINQIQRLRKQNKLSVSQRIIIYLNTEYYLFLQTINQYYQKIQKETLVQKIILNKNQIEEYFYVNQIKIYLSITKYSPQAN